MVIFMLSMNVVCVPTKHNVIQEHLRNLYASLQQLYSQTPEHVRIAQTIINHFRTHNHLVWNQDVQHISLHNDVLPRKDAIINTIYDFYPSDPKTPIDISPKIIRGEGFRHILLPQGAAQEEEHNPFLSIGKAVTNNQIETLDDNTVKAAQSFYKIHLMPYPKDVPRVIEHLMTKLTESQNAQHLQSIYHIKFSRNFHFALQKPTPLYTYDIACIFPQVVIYPIHDKQATETFLHWLINIFDGWQGTNLHPRFNAKVNNLIYYIQGNADDRFEDTTAHVFDPATNYTFLNTKPFEKYPEKFTIFQTQRLVDPTTGKPFDAN